MPNSEIFNDEISLIENQKIKDFMVYYLNNATPKYFWTVGASAGGKYHPKFAQGEGGLVKHTKVAVKFATELLKMSSYAYLPQDYKDYAIAALILHDTIKYGDGDEIDKTQYKDHAPNASNQVNKVWRNHYHEDAPYLLTSAIRTHMGQWSEKENRPFTQVDRLVHLSDYLASRNWIEVDV